MAKKGLEELMYGRLGRRKGILLRVPWEEAGSKRGKDAFSEIASLKKKNEEEVDQEKGKAQTNTVKSTITAIQAQGLRSKRVA